MRVCTGGSVYSFLSGTYGMDSTKRKGSLLVFSGQSIFSDNHCVFLSIAIIYHVVWHTFYDAPLQAENSLSESYSRFVFGFICCEVAVLQ